MLKRTGAGNDCWHIQCYISRSCGYGGTIFLILLFLSSDRLHSESGYMSSPERGGPRVYPAAAYPPGGPGYEDPYYSQYASRSGSITPVIDEEARWADFISWEKEVTWWELCYNLQQAFFIHKHISLRFYIANCLWNCRIYGCCSAWHTEVNEGEVVRNTSICT